ncbi:WhiB family transcriptional regulator [Allokutzneria sp. A3M-2-11 16]|uniref:WhiB family transcriptional regulator n=1 Tax=Allokutzneria sp. A3M-2-11 16 TaxID=2962043 RepID=UPI0020B76A16|nr:WhiB family transcriptional regulator [Allokutzneria sp. A3M-2-11 16]MCP3804960.1 WhiB family transcriptional regulator [Allokutzneria sp. A3M-2-11 16]
MTDNDEEFSDKVAADLDRFADTSTGELWDVVSRDGLCQWLYTSGDAPDWSGDDRADRLRAARICAGCPVAAECLEWELRTAGYATAGIWGVLDAEDRRRVFLSWSQRRGGGERQ